MTTKLAVLASVLIVLLVAAYLAAGYRLYDQLSTVARNPQNALNTPAHFQVYEPAYAGLDTTPYLMPSYAIVRFPSRQTCLMLAGWYVPGDAAAPAVVLAHGRSSCKCEAAVLIAAGMLHRHGFSVLLFDLRNHGQSDRDDGRTAMGNKEYQDVLGAWDWLRTAKGFAPERIGVYGPSLGAGTTMVAFGQEPRMAALFVDSPFFDLRQLIREELTRSGYPTFLAEPGIFMARVVGQVNLDAHSPQAAITRAAGRPIFDAHGASDPYINIHHSRDLVQLAAQSGANLTTWFPEGIDHHPDAIYKLPGDYEQHLAGFFQSALEK